MSYSSAAFAGAVCFVHVWYEVRRCVFNCYIGSVNVVVVRPPAAVHQPRTHTP